ncbi:MAG: serine hydrolase, partial [Rhodospirillaceae bacterium]|nr:serine hydrolase [Rhodospirillaceae bacterium]
PIHAPNATDIYRPLEKVAGAPTPQPLPRRPAPADRFAEVRRIAETMDSYAVLVWHDGAIVFDYAGPGLTGDIRPDGASMHKSIAALAVGAAIDRGLIAGPDVAMGTLLPEWAERPEGAITLANVLGMTTGLTTFSSAGGPLSEATRFLGGLDPRGLTLSRTLQAPPGSAFAYRNLNSYLLGLAIEAGTGQRYAAFLSQALWQPLGAADAFVWLDRPGGTARTYTALLARPEDWLRIGLLIKDRGAFLGQRVISAAWIDAMLTPSPLYANYGYQVWFAEPFLATRYYNPTQRGLNISASAPFKAADTVFFDGVGGQRVYISRAQDSVIVRLGVARPDWDDTALPNAVADALASQPEG